MFVLGRCSTLWRTVKGKENQNLLTPMGCVQSCQGERKRDEDGDICHLVFDIFLDYKQSITEKHEKTD